MSALPECFRTEFRAMGGNNEIVVAAADRAAATAAMEAAAREVLRIEAKFSRYRDDSVIGHINRAAGKPDRIVCDDETTMLLNFADTLYRQSDGLFDITSGILRKAWDFKVARLPDQAHLESLLELVDWPRVERVGATIRLPHAGMELDFGGFGKEYAADRAAGVLQERGIAHGYVNLGGDIHAIGPQPGGEPWLIGVQNPREKGAVIASIPLSRGGLATSGDYERYFELDGRRYSHVLNPQTGFPSSCFASVSVVAPLAIVAGSHSTIAMLKEAAGLDFLRAARLSFLAVDLEGRIASNSTDTSGV